MTADAEHRSSIFSSSGPFNWTFPAIVQNTDAGLGEVSTESLRICLRPVMEGLKILDAEDLFNLDRVPNGEGPSLGDR